MPFRYTLRLSDGSDAGEAELDQQPKVGEEIRINGNRLMIVRAIVPVERIEEFLDRPIYGILEVEPLRR